jgi:hypothetical protein
MLRIRFRQACRSALVYIALGPLAPGLFAAGRLVVLNVDGGGQTGQASAALPGLITVTGSVFDINNNLVPVQGLEIGFEVLTSPGGAGATFSPPTISTGSGGSQLTLGNLPGAYQFTAIVKTVGFVGTANFSETAVAAPLTITTTSITAVTFNTPYTPFTFKASGGIPPDTWTAQADNTYPPLTAYCSPAPQPCFPPGLQFDSPTISPGPSTDLVSGAYNLAVTVTDSTNTSAGPVTLLLTVSCGFGTLDALTGIYRTYPRDNVGTVTLQGYFVTGDQFIPACSSFTQTAHSSLYPFTSQFLPGEPYTWALIRSPLTAPAALLPAGIGLDTWVTVFSSTTAAQGQNYGPRVITSGYRDPQYNQTVSTALNGRHQFGDAIDLNNNSWDTFGNSPQSMAEHEAMCNAADLAGADYIEPWSMVANASQKGHGHADWRNTSGPYQQ